MSEEGFLLDAESIEVLQRLQDAANLSRDLTTPQSVVANPAVSIYVFILGVMTQAEIEDLYEDVGSLPIPSVNKFYNGYQVVWNGAAWSYKKGGAVFGNDSDLENDPFFDGPKIRTLTVPDLRQLQEGESITQLEADAVYVAYPTYSTGRPTVEDTALESTFGWNAFVSQPIIYMIDTPYDSLEELEWLCHLDRTGNNINVNTASLVGDPGETGTPLSEYLVADFTGFVCGFLDLDKDKLFTDVTELSDCLSWDGVTLTVDPDCVGDINIGCGLSGTGTVLDPFIINNTDLIDADGGLEEGDGTCDLKIKLVEECGIESLLTLQVGGLGFDLDKLVDPTGAGGLENLFDCLINIKLDTDCNVFTLSTDGLGFDSASLLGTGLVNLFDCEMAVDIGDGLGFNGNKIDVNTKRSIEIDADFLQLVGDVDVVPVFSFYGTSGSVGPGGLGYKPLDNLAGTGLAFDAINGWLETDPTDSIENTGLLTGDQFHLRGDEAAPTARKYYGTNTTNDNLGYHLGDAVTLVTDITSLSVSGTTVTINFETIAARILDGSATPAADTATHTAEECT